MKNARNSIIALALTALSAGSVFAADMTPKTRDQVRAELAQAQRDGTLMVRGDPTQLQERLRQGGERRPRRGRRPKADQFLLEHTLRIPQITRFAKKSALHPFQTRSRNQPAPSHPAIELWPRPGLLRFSQWPTCMMTDPPASPPRDAGWPECGPPFGKPPI